MRQPHGTAIGTGNQVVTQKSVVRASAVAASLRVLAFWMWGHDIFPLQKISNEGKIIVASASDVKHETS